MSSIQYTTAPMDFQKLRFIRYIPPANFSSDSRQETFLVQKQQFVKKSARLTNTISTFDQNSQPQRTYKAFSPIELKLYVVQAIRNIESTPFLFSRCSQLSPWSKRSCRSRHYLSHMYCQGSVLCFEPWGRSSGVWFRLEGALA